MQISARDNTVIITGNIKSVSDFQVLKDFLDQFSQNHSNIIIKIPESISITSAVIGYLTKLKLKNSIEISMYIGDKRLYRLLDELNLIRLFNVNNMKVN